jgi:hypothetical protein
MLFEDPSRRYPYLVQALNVLGRRQFGTSVTGSPWSFFLPLLLALWVVTQASSPIATVLGSIVGVLMLVLGVQAFRKSRIKPPPVDMRAIEATQVAQSMSQMLTKRRLHRDLDQGSLILLEECARHWTRARTALEGPFWTAGDVPAHYQSVRLQALTALDKSMDEVLLHYRAWIPDDVPNRHALDYVDEALEQFTLKGTKRADFIPPAFVPVREIAEKLRSLADEAERMAREVRVDPEVAAQFAPGRSLDQTLGELRQIREAEEELRQNLHG